MRPLVYVRLYRSPRAAPPPTQYPVEKRFEALSAPQLPGTRNTTSPFVVDQFSAQTLQRPTSYDAYLAQRDAFDERERARFDKDTVAAQLEAAQPIDISDKLISFRYEQETGKADQCSIVIDNFDLSEFDNSTWKTGGILEVRWGYPGNMAPFRRVKIDKIRGGRELNIEALGIEILMHESKRTRTWRGTNLRQLVEEVTGEYKAEFHAAIDQHSAVLQYHDTLRKLKPPGVFDEQLTGFREARRKHFPMVSRLAKKWSEVFGVPLQMVYTIIRIESDFDPYETNTTDDRAMSRAGAWGAMQVTLNTAIGEVPKLAALATTNPEIKSALDAWDGTGQSMIENQPEDKGPNLSIMLGTYYLAKLWRRYGGDYQKAGLAYHQGPGTIDDAIKAGVPLQNKIGPKGKIYLDRLNEFYPYFGRAQPTQAAPVQAATVPGLPPIISAIVEKVQSGLYLAKQALGIGKPGIDASAEQVKLETVHQSAMTDAQLLSQMATKYGYVFYVDNDGFVFEKNDEIYRRPPDKTMVWYFGEGEFLDFTYEHDPKKKKDTKKGVDVANASAFEHVASNETTKRAGSGVRISEGELLDPNKWDKMTGERLVSLKKAYERMADDEPQKKKFAQAIDGLEKLSGLMKSRGTEEIGPSSAGNPDKAKASNDGQYVGLAMTAHQIRGRIIGDPQLKVHSLVEIQGIGRRLSGKWAMRKVSHAVERDGYVCGFEAQRDGDNGYGELAEADSKAAQNKAEAPPPAKVHEWNVPTGRRLKQATDTTDPMRVRTDEEVQ